MQLSQHQPSFLIFLLVVAHNLDRKAVEDLSQTLKTKIGDFIEQIFLITHDEKLEDSVTGNLYRLERDKQKDGVTKVIQVN